MDSSNLATLFGPNILHKSKGGEFQVESPERAEQRSDVIAVVKDLIDNYVQLFEVSLIFPRIVVISSENFLDVEILFYSNVFHSVKTVMCTWK